MGGLRHRRIVVQTRNEVAFLMLLMDDFEQDLLAGADQGEAVATRAALVICMLRRGTGE
jgi:hypothetical protein